MSNKGASIIAVVVSLLLVSLASSCELPESQVTRNDEDERWRIRYNNPAVQKYFTVKTFPDGFRFRTRQVYQENGELFVYCHLRIDSLVSSLSFDYNMTGDAALVPITLLDAAANELWRNDGRDSLSGMVELKDLNLRGQLVFRIGRNRPVDLPADWSHEISNIRLNAGDQNVEKDKDGFFLVDNMTDLRGYAAEDNVKIRLKPGYYQIDKAFCTRFIEFSGNGCHYDLSGANIMVDTRLFTSAALARGEDGNTLYCVLELSGDNSTMEGLYVETYGDRPGRQSKNKIFNICGSDVTLKNTEVRTSGSSPWGYGSFYGLGGGDVRKMNGIRVGWPAKNVKIIGCRVHMRAMGHAIFIQGAENTLIEDCHVDGLLRTTDDILAETSGYAYDRDFKARKGGYIEGVTVAGDGSFLPGEMFSLSEDGIRMYPAMGNDHPTGSTTIVDCSVTKMRRGICTGLSAAGDKVINCRVTNCVATAFNVGSGDTLISCAADAKYAEALCLPYTKARNAYVEMEILDSRGGMQNILLAKLNGEGHEVSLQTADSTFIPDSMVIEFSTAKGYGTYRGTAEPHSENIRLVNKTPAGIILNPGTKTPQIESEGELFDRRD